MQAMADLMSAWARRGTPPSIGSSAWRSRLLGARFDLLEDELEILTRLMTGEVVSYRGNQISLDGAQLRPVPVQRPHPPIWIGGTGRRRTLPLVARHADVWHADRLHDHAELSREVEPARRGRRS